MLCISKDLLDRSARKEIYNTADGPVGLYLLPDGVHVELVGEDGSILSDALADINADVLFFFSATEQFRGSE